MSYKNASISSIIAIVNVSKSKGLLEQNDLEYRSIEYDEIFSSTQWNVNINYDYVKW